jgi:twinkle protein
MNIEIPIEGPADIANRVLALYDTGLPRGDSTGWRAVDQFYTVGPKQWTAVTGIPGSGKSEWLDALLVNLAGGGEWTFAFYSPENFPVELHASKLIEKRSGKPFGAGPTPRMTKAEADEVQHWVHEHFMWLAPRQKSYVALLEAASRFRCANKNFGVILDPWNTLEHQRPARLSETEYIAMALTDATNWVRENDAHLWIVCHPAKIYKDTATGKRPVPTPYDMAGSAHWYNKADNIIAVHRDQVEQAPDVEIYVQKVRFKNIGRVGVATLKYDKVTGRYFEPPPARIVEGNDYANVRG